MTSLKQIAGSMIIIGILLAVIGYTSGAKWGFVVNSSGIHMPNEKSLVTHSYELDAFTSIDIDNEYGDVEILPSDSYSIEIKAFDTTFVTYHVSGGTLTVDAKNPSDDGFTIGLPSFETPIVKIYVPKDVKLSNIAINSEFGEVNLQHLNVKKLNLFASYGEVTMENIVAGHSEITQSFGEISLQQFTSDGFVATSEYGDIFINGVLNGKSVITSSFGEVELQLQNKESELGLDLDTSFGDITFNNRSIEGDYSKSHKGDNQLQVSISYGDLDLSLK